MAARTPTRRRARQRRPTRTTLDTAPPVRAATLRAVERVLSSEEAFALLIRRLEAAGWQVQRDDGGPAKRVREAASLTPPARAR